MTTATATDIAEERVRAYDDAALQGAVDDAAAAFAASVTGDWPDVVAAFGAWLDAIDRHNRRRAAFVEAHHAAYGGAGPWGDYPAHAAPPIFTDALERAVQRAARNTGGREA